MIGIACGLSLRADITETDEFIKITFSESLPLRNNTRLPLNFAMILILLAGILLGTDEDVQCTALFLMSSALMAVYRKVLIQKNWYAKAFRSQSSILINARSTM